MSWRYGIKESDQLWVCCVFQCSSVLSLPSREDSIIFVHRSDSVLAVSPALLLSLQAH